jgi:hypothetical protein
VKQNIKKTYQERDKGSKDQEFFVFEIFKDLLYAFGVKTEYQKKDDQVPTPEFCQKKRRFHSV